MGKVAGTFPMFMVLLRSGMLASAICRFFNGPQSARERVPDEGRFVDPRRQFSRPPAPRRGSMIIAQGKVAEAAALGKEPNQPTSFFTSGFARQGRAKPEGKNEGIILRP